MDNYCLFPDQMVDNRFKVIKEIGQGATAHVYKAIDSKSNSFVAIKFYTNTNLKDQKDLQYIEQEVQFLQETTHPNIMKCFKVIEEETTISVVLEYIDGITMDDFIRTQFKDLPMFDKIVDIKALVKELAPLEQSNDLLAQYHKIIRQKLQASANLINMSQQTLQAGFALKSTSGSQSQSSDINQQQNQQAQEQSKSNKQQQYFYYSTLEHIYRQLINVLIFLEGKHYIHRDLKPENIMITKELQIKVIDFGFCRQDKPKEKAKTGMIGTPAYMAPEVHLKNEATGQFEYTSKVDVWSVGVILYQMLYGYLPFIMSKLPRFEFLQIEKCLILPGDLFGKVYVNDKYIRIVQSCLQFDPQKRGTPQDLLKILAEEGSVPQPSEEEKKQIQAMQAKDEQKQDEVQDSGDQVKANWVIDNRFKIQKELGKGSTAHVYKAVDTKSKNFVAVKHYLNTHLMDSKDLQYIEQEVSFLKDTNHPNIMRCYKIIKEEETIYVILELIDGITLDNFIGVQFKDVPQIDKLLDIKQLVKDLTPHEQEPNFLQYYQTIIKEKISQQSNLVNISQNELQSGFTIGNSQNKQACDIDSEPGMLSEQAQSVQQNSQNSAQSYIYYSTIDHIFKQLINVLIFLDTKHIMHRDLKPDNIMVTKDLQIKLIDFGFCRQDKIKDTKSKTGFVGTPAYMAPEVHFKNQQTNEFEYTSKVDVWSTGVILYQMLYGYLPFIMTKLMRFELMQVEKCLVLPGNLFGKLSVDAKYMKIVQQCLVPDPNQRATPSELLKTLQDESSNSATNSQDLNQQQTSPQESMQSLVLKQLNSTNTQSQQQARPTYLMSQTRTQLMTLQSKMAMGVSSIQLNSLKQDITVVQQPTQEDLSMPQYKIKIVLVGDYGVGKTTLIQKFTGQSPKPPQQSQVTDNNEGVTSVIIRLKKQYLITLDFYDTQELEKAQNYQRNVKYLQLLKNTNICLLVYNSKNKQTHDNLKIHKALVEKNTKGTVFYCLCNNFGAPFKRDASYNVVLLNCYLDVSKDTCQIYALQRVIEEWIQLNSQ